MTNQNKKPRSRKSNGRTPFKGAIPERIWILSLFLMAWVHRILFLHSNSDHDWGFSIFYEGDSEVFYDYARSILLATPYDLGVPFHPPLFAHTLAFVHQLVGAGDATAQVPQETVRIVLATIGAAIIPTLYVLVRPYLGRTTASVSALLCLYHFGMNVLSVAPTAESLYLWLLLSSLILWSRLGGHPWGVPVATSGSRRRLEASPSLRILAGVGLGILLGLLSLTRAEGISIALLLLLTGGLGSLVADRREALKLARGLASGHGTVTSADPAPTRKLTTKSNRPSRRFGQKRTHIWMAASLAILLVLIPWTIRNARNLAHVNEQLKTQLVEPLPTFVPLTLYGPLNFALANNGLATGGFSRASMTSQSTSASLDLTDPQHLRFLLHGYEIGGTFIREHPAEFAQLVWQKWTLFFGVFRLGWTQWDLPGGLEGVREPVDIFVPDSSAGVWFVLPWLLLGLAVLSRSGRTESRWLALVLGFTGLSATTTAFFFGYARLGLLCIPFWMTLVAAAIVWLCRRVFVRSPDRTRVAGLASSEFFLSRGFRVMLIVITVLFLVEAWGATGIRNFEAEGSRHQDATHLNPHERMWLRVVKD